MGKGSGDNTGLAPFGARGSAAPFHAIIGACITLPTSPALYSMPAAPCRSWYRATTPRLGLQSYLVWAVDFLMLLKEAISHMLPAINPPPEHQPEYMFLTTTFTPWVSEESVHQASAVILHTNAVQLVAYTSAVRTDQRIIVPVSCASRMGNGLLRATTKTIQYEMQISGGCSLLKSRTLLMRPLRHCGCPTTLIQVGRKAAQPYRPRCLGTALPFPFTTFII